MAERLVEGGELGIGCAEARGDGSEWEGERDGGHDGGLAVGCCVYGGERLGKCEITATKRLLCPKFWEGWIISLPPIPHARGFSFSFDFYLFHFLPHHLPFS